VDATLESPWTIVMVEVPAWLRHDLVLDDTTWSDHPSQRSAMVWLPDKSGTGG
jgi:hypothetical protein